MKKIIIFLSVLSIFITMFAFSVSAEDLTLTTSDSDMKTVINAFETSSNLTVGTIYDLYIANHSSYPYFMCYSYVDAKYSIFRCFLYFSDSPLTIINNISSHSPCFSNYVYQYVYSNGVFTNTADKQIYVIKQAPKIMGSMD